MIKKLPLILFLLAFAFSIQTLAQTDAPTEKQQAIKELVAVVNADNRAEQLVDAMSAQFQSLYDASFRVALEQRSDLSQADKKALKESFNNERTASIKRFQDKLMQKLNYGEMLLDVSLIVYDKYYTLEEIREITAFYRTPTGQKTLKMMPQLMTDTMQLIQDRLLPKIPMVLKEIETENRLEIEQKINARKPKPKNQLAN